MAASFDADRALGNSTMVLVVLGGIYPFEQYNFQFAKAVISGLSMVCYENYCSTRHALVLVRHAMDLRI